MTAPFDFADGCPECFPDAEHAVLPSSAPVPDRGSLRAHYRHETCGTEWDCWFNPDSVDGWPLRREAAA